MHTANGQAVLLTTSAAAPRQLMRPCGCQRLSVCSTSVHSATPCTRFWGCARLNTLVNLLLSEANSRPIVVNVQFLGVGLGYNLGKCIESWPMGNQLKYHNSGQEGQTHLAHADGTYMQSFERTSQQKPCEMEISSAEMRYPPET